MFEPPFCPYRACPRHLDPGPKFFSRHGTYRAQCRPHPIPRFVCKTCERTFSRQTFRMDYRDHKPHLNTRLFELLASGVGLRQCGRNLKLSLRCTELKARKIGRHLRRLNLNLRGPLPSGASLQLDELETYEGRRNTRPLSVPVLIETESRFVVWAESAPIPPSGRMLPERRAAIDAEALKNGRRTDNSPRAVRRTLQRAQPLLEHVGRLRVDTDCKSNYPRLIDETLGSPWVEHIQTSSHRDRDMRNPLFPINQTEAIARDLMGRLRRESWLVSKRRRWLDVALHVFIAYRNSVRRRFNFDGRTPTQHLGYVPRPLSPSELLSLRQEPQLRSIHPLSRSTKSIEEFNLRLRRA